LSRPVLVARSASRQTAGWVAPLAHIGVIVIATLTYLATRDGLLPWTPVAPEWVYKLGAFTLAVSLSALVRWRQRHRGLKVDFHEQVILFGVLGGRVGVEVPWSDVAGFKDGDADSVELLRRPGAPRLKMKRPLLVPTPTEADRTAVLALLIERGVSRVER
jgi:hypothetical protein